MELFLLTGLYIFLLSFFVMVVGSPMTGLLPQAFKKNYSFYFTPIFGLAIVMLCSMAYGWLFPFSFKYSSRLALILLGLGLYFSNHRLNLLKESLIFGSFAVCVSLPFLVPFWKFGGYNPGTDIYTYISQAQWMQLHAFKETVTPSGYFPYLTQISLYQQTGSRMGASFMLGYWQSLLHLSWAYEALFPAVGVAFASGCLTLIAGVRQFVEMSFYRLLCLALWTAFSLNGFQFGAAWGFYPQTYGLAFISGVIALFPLIFNHLVNQHPSWTKKILLILPLGLLMGAFLQAYNEPFLIFGFGFGLFMMISFICFPQHRKIWPSFAFILLVEVAIFTNYEMIRIYRNLFQTLSITKVVGSIGWIVPWRIWKFLAYPFGLQLSLGHNNLHSILLYPIFSIVLLSMTWTFFKLWQEKNIAIRTNIIWLACFFLACSTAFIKFRYFSDSINPEEKGFSFLQFKIAKYLTPIAQIMILTAFAYAWKNFKNHRKNLSILYTLCLSVFLIFHFFIFSNVLHKFYFKQMHTTKYSIKNWEKLRQELDFIPKNEPLFLNFKTEEAKIKEMLTYVFYDRMVTADFSDDGYIQGKLPESERIKSKKNVHYQISIRTSKEQKSLIDDLVFVVTPYKP